MMRLERRDLADAVAAEQADHFARRRRSSDTPCRMWLLP